MLRPFRHGVLENGMTFYVRHRPKPTGRASLKLAVRVGSVQEEDDEQGLAHIIEHLAFSATEKYENHDIVHLLEAVGAEFGACSNAGVTTSSSCACHFLLKPYCLPLGPLSDDVRYDDV